tara:strand:+ start:772 stop:2064 length:1293 start_codon:yes stop_codon:yes gene_type:complete
MRKISKLFPVINEIKKNNYNQALELLSKIIAEPEDKHLENKLYASIFFKKENWVKSIEYYHKILEVDKKDLVALNNLAVALFKLEKFNQSIAFLKKLLKIEKNPSNTYKSLGLAYKNIGKYDDAISNYLKLLDIEEDNNSVKQSLINIFNHHIPKETKNNFILKLNNKILKLNEKLNYREFVDIEIIKEFIKKNFDIIDELDLLYNETQIFRRNKTDLNCDRHFNIFNEFNIIPKYCFNCFKVQIELENIKDLIKLFFIFNSIKLRDNNIRKCVVETRNNIRGNYKGFIFCKGLLDAKEVMKITSYKFEKFNLKPKNIIIKHGCTEFYDKFPEFKKINFDGEQNFKYSKEWEKIENFYDKRLLKNNDNNEKVVGPTHNKINLSDILIIKNWFAYAKLIGDSSYLEFYKNDININFLSNSIKNQINFRKQN